MNSGQYRTEAEYVVTYPSGRFISEHYTSKGAIEASKVKSSVRIIHGRHRGIWAPILTYKDGILVQHQVKPPDQS